jgi:hypothetical protein
MDWDYTYDVEVVRDAGREEDYRYEVEAVRESAWDELDGPNCCWTEFENDDEWEAYDAQQDANENEMHLLMAKPEKIGLCPIERLRELRDYAEDRTRTSSYILYEDAIKTFNTEIGWRHASKGDGWTLVGPKKTKSKTFH